MSWIRLDDKFARHPKIAALTDREFRTHIETMCWCADYETEGVISEGAFAVVKYLDEKTARRFVSLGIWDEKDGVRCVHDWKVYNGSTVEERVEAYLAKNPDASANEVHRILRGKRALVLAAYAKLKADDPVPPQYPSGSQNGSAAGTPSRDVRAGAAPAPAPQVLTSPSSVVEAAAPDDDDEKIVRELIGLAVDENQERQWLGLYRENRSLMAGRLRTAKVKATTNVGAYLDRMISNDSQPEISADVPSIYAACRNWIVSPGFDPETMDLDRALEEFQRKERKMGDTLDPLQRTELLHIADERIEAAHAPPSTDET